MELLLGNYVSTSLIVEILSCIDIIVLFIFDNRKNNHNTIEKKWNKTENTPHISDRNIIYFHQNKARICKETNQL